MKLSIITILFLFVQTTVLQASGIDIDAQIAKIEQASEADRFRLVNQLKQQIAQMNANQQARAIARYQQETLSVQQQANYANEIVINNQLQKEQDRQTIVPPIETVHEEIHIPDTENPQTILTPQPQKQTPVEQPEVPTYQQPVTQEPLPIEKPDAIPVTKPIQEPIMETPIQTPSKTIEKPQEIFIEQPQTPEPVYVQPIKKTPTPKVEPVETPTYTAPSKPTTSKPNTPSFSKGRF